MSAVISLISEISISSVAVSLNGGEYKASLIWEINGNPSASYQGDYDIRLFEGTKEIETQTVKNVTTFGDVIFKNLTEGKSYSVSILSPKEAGQQVESDKMPLITDHYKGFSGVFDGKALSLAWEADAFRVPNGMCVLNAENGYNCVYDIYPGAERAVLDVACGREFTVQACSVQDNSQGPDSDTLTFYSTPPFITDVEVTSNKNGGTDIKVAFTSGHDDIASVSLVLSMDGEKVYESEPVKMTEPGGKYSVTVTIAATVLTRGEIEKCTVSCVYVNGSAKSVLCGDGSEMPLARPSVNAVDVQGGKAVMRISYPESASALGFELSDGKSVVSVNAYTVDLTAQTPAIRPRFDRNGTARRGVSSEPAPGFVPGYYMSGGGLIYRGADFSQKEVTHTWSEELFTAPLAEPIDLGTLSLTRGDNGYTLKISNAQNLSRADYNKFIDELKDSKDGVTPYGFYALTGVILRIAPQALGDTPFFLCAFSPDDRYSDIRPGLRLTVDTALYMPQPNSNLENAEGFVSVNNASWSFVLNNAGSFLEPDLFMGLMAEYMSDGSPNDATKVTYAAGAADFMRSSLHKPYYRVLFPKSLERSVAAEDPFPSENTVIMASDSYKEILEACTEIHNNPASINQLGIPLMIFRGRSALSLSMPIQINGNICHAPVGCNVGQALGMHGYGCSASIRMMREDDNRVPRPVFVGEDARLGELPLIPGDRLEVQYDNQSD